MRTTLKDIARQTNVSVTLVGNVLNDRPGGRASAQTLQRIRDTARRLNYRVNPAGRNLQNGRSNCVAFVHTRTSPPPILSGSKPGIEICAEILAEAGFDTRLVVFADQPAALQGLRELAHSGAVDLIALWNGNSVEVREQAELAESLNLSFVAFGRFEAEHPDWPQVDFDHEGMTREAVEYLWQRGHRNIAYVGYDAEATFIRALETGYRETLSKLREGHMPDNLTLRVVHYRTTQDDIKSTVARWMSLPASDRPTAIVMGLHDHFWQGLEYALLDHGLFIGPGPGEIEVIGQAYYRGCLTFGNAVTHSHIDDSSVAEAMVKRLLVPMMQRKELEENVVRVVPDLAPLSAPSVTAELRERFMLGIGDVAVS